MKQGDKKQYGLSKNLPRAPLKRAGRTQNTVAHGQVYEDPGRTSLKYSGLSTNCENPERRLKEQTRRTAAHGFAHGLTH